MGIAKKPAIRFAGFSDDWEQRKLGEVLSALKDGTHGTHKDSNSGIFLLSAKNIKNGEIVIDEKTDRIISIQEFESIHSKFKLQKDDVLLTIVGSIGDVAMLINPDIMTFQRSVAYLRPTERLSSTFLKTEIETDIFQKELTDRKSQSAQPGVYLGELDRIPFKLPEIEEQHQIGTFFHSLDSLITLYQRKLDKLKNIKKSMLEKMFPKNGSNVPEIRFKGFTDAWERRKCKEVCSISTGKSNTQDRIDDGIYPFYVRSPIIERSNRFLFDEEAVLTVGDGVGTGKVYHYVNGKYDLHQRCYRMFGFSDDISAKYFYYFFSNHFYDRVMAMTAKTSVDSVRYEMIADMDVSLPDRAEQCKISAYFEILDSHITLQQRELEKLKNIKKSLLEKMFV